MALETQLAHRNIRNTNLPYQTNVSPTQTDPYLAFGSADILTSVAGYAERRPGFSDHVETTPTTFNNLQRLFTWDRFDGSFIVMACDVNATMQAVVYKMVLGTDVSFISIYTDSAATPFDFAVSNNTVYFSNGNTAKKWDPINGLSNWGIAIGSVNNASGPTIAGNGVSAGGGPVWTNPNNVTSAVSFATTNVSSGTNSTSATLKATQFGFSLSASEIINGIQVSFTGEQSNGSNIFPGVEFIVTLVKAGNIIGTSKYIGNVPTSPTAYTVGGSSDLWATGWTYNDINQTNFGVSFTVYNPSGLASTFSVNNVKITIFGTGGPTVTLVAGGFNPAPSTGYIYEFCYGNSATGHISSPSPVSALIKPDASHSVQIGLTASTDPQVNQIHVFRDVDGGGSPLTFFEIPTSPYPNTTANVVDSAADTALNISSIAPTATFNDPPTPGRATQYFSGRFWLFNGNKVNFSGLEEIVQGVPEESFPSGTAGNFWSFDQPVQAEGVAGSGQDQTLGVFCGGRLYGIVGNTLDTFQRYLVSHRRGCRNVTCTATLGGMVAWLDTSNQIWATNGSSLQELSTDIRPDLVGINPATCSMTFHVAGRFHWLVFSTGTKLFVYDMDLEQWMPPWSFACQYIYSGETSPGNYVLMAATATTALQLNITKFNDNGVTYQPILNFGNLAVVPDFGRRFSYVAAGIYDEPSRTGYPEIFQITNNAQTLADVLILNDEDPKLGTYTSIAANLQDTVTTYNRKNGTFMTQRVYPTNQPAARWISLQVKLQNADQVDNIYEAFMAYKSAGGR